MRRALLEMGSTLGGLFPASRAGSAEWEEGDVGSEGDRAEGEEPEVPAK